MKRAFLFGLGCYLLLLAITGAITAVIESLHSNRMDVVTGVIFLVVCAPLSMKVILSAKAAPPSRSRLRSVLGWLMGFFLIAGALVVFGAITWLLT